MITVISDIEDKILSDPAASVVYVTQKDKMDYLPVIEELARDYGAFMNIALYVIDDVQKSQSDLKKEFKSSKLPHLRFYPNAKTSDDKRANSFEIVLPKG